MSWYLLRLWPVLLCVIANLASLQTATAQAQKTEPATQNSPSKSDTGSKAKIELPATVLKPTIDVEELELRLVPLKKKELKQLAEKWLDIVKAKTEQVMEAQVSVAKTKGEAEASAREKLTHIVSERKELFDKYSSVLNAWEKKGADPKAITDYWAYRNSIIVEETRTADVKTLFARTLSWISDEDGGIRLAKDIGVVAVAFVLLLMVAAIARRFARRWIGHVPNISKLLQAFLIGVVYWLVLAFGLMVVLSALGVDITPLFALIGGASFIIAFALQDTLGNLASGLMIMIYRPFDEGDYVDVGGVSGTVKTVNIVATTVTTPDNQVIVIPNKNVWGNIITNVTASETRRVDLVFGTSYDDSIPETLQVLEDTVNAHPLVLKDPEPTIRVHELADSSVNFICRPWTQTSDYWTVYWDLMRQVKERFDEAGISIPYPQQDVYVREGSSPLARKERDATSEKKQGTTQANRISVSAGDDGSE
ncbi:MAG: mechanosensitive ion channel family protein [Hyphomicrobiaceae bacterium]